MKILIVEADPKTSNALQLLLEKRHYQVKAIPNPLEAWRALESETYSSIILGMVTGMDSLELCRKIRDRKTTMYTCVALMTAKQAKEERRKALAAGADLFLSNPIEEDDLVARLQIAERILTMEQGTTPKLRAA